MISLAASWACAYFSFPVCKFDLLRDIYTGRLHAYCLSTYFTTVGSGIRGPRAEAGSERSSIVGSERRAVGIRITETWKGVGGRRWRQSLKKSREKNRHGSLACTRWSTLFERTSSNRASPDRQYLLEESPQSLFGNTNIPIKLDCQVRITRKGDLDRPSERVFVALVGDLCIMLTPWSLGAAAEKVGLRISGQPNSIPFATAFRE